MPGVHSWAELDSRKLTLLTLLYQEGCLCRATVFYVNISGRVQSGRKKLKIAINLVGRLDGIHNNPHKWRRQFVTELLEKDVPLQIVADLAGHENMNTTKENYANYSKSKAKDVHKKYIV